jgi:hypothetical protein
VVKTVTSLPSTLPAMPKDSAGARALSEARTVDDDDSWLFANTNAADEAARKPRRFVFIIDNFNIFVYEEDLPSVLDALSLTDIFARPLSVFS